MAFITLTPENVMSEHLCCAIADKKHQTGVNDKRNWLAERIKEGHVFRKLDAQGKVFIEYAPLEKAWVPVTGDNYFYIYCVGADFGRQLPISLLPVGIRQLQRKGIRKGIVTIVHRRRKSARKIRHLPPFFQKEETFLIRKEVHVEIWLQSSGYHQ